jgi:hypothetical protein
MHVEQGLVAAYSAMHAETPSYGTTGIGVARSVIPYLRIAKFRTVLDYGCGKGRLAEYMSDSGHFEAADGYDPAIPGFSEIRRPRYDAAVNVDMLEHIPEHDIDDVIAHISSLSSHAFFVIDTRLAKAILPDGRNAHLTVKPAGWWREKLERHYSVIRPAKCGRADRAVFRTWESSARETMLWPILYAEETVRCHYWKKRRRAAQGG